MIISKNKLFHSMPHTGSAARAQTNRRMDRQTKCIISLLRSVDSLDGGATDVPILGTMEITNYIIVLFIMFLLTHRFQNFLRIENRTIISRDTTSFVQEGQVFHSCYKNKHSKYVCLLFLDRLTDGKSRK